MLQKWAQQVGWSKTIQKIFREHLSLCSSVIVSPADFSEYLLTQTTNTNTSWGTLSCRPKSHHLFGWRNSFFWPMSGATKLAEFLTENKNMADFTEGHLVLTKQLVTLRLSHGPKLYHFKTIWKPSDPFWVGGDTLAPLRNTQPLKINLHYMIEV